MRIILGMLLPISFIACVSPVTSISAEPGWNEVGVRIGYQANHNHEYFRQYEAFAAYGLPWKWRSASGWGLTPEVNVSLGALENGEETGFIGALGTAVALDKQGYGITTDLGINFDILGKRYFSRLDFGSTLQFGAYIGINYRFDNGIKIGYRLQHLSNGHIFYPEDTPNPGLDMHMFGISYVF